MTGQQPCVDGGDPALCCQPGAWDRFFAIGALYALPEPLPEAVAEVAAAEGVDPHELAHHVEGMHGWEPHDTGYRDAVGQAARCLQAGGCET